MLPDHYRVFISHGSEDRWIAAQIGRCVRDLGAGTFLDETDIPKGADFKEIIRREIAASNEIIALFTPSSAKRSWVWIEIGVAWGQNKTVVAVFYGMKIRDLERSGQGRGSLEDINVVQLNDLERYFVELAARVKGATGA